MLTRDQRRPSRTVAVWMPRLLCYLLLPTKGLAVGTPDLGTTVSCIQATVVQTTTGLRELSSMLPENAAHSCQQYVSPASAGTGRAPPVIDPWFGAAWLPVSPGTAGADSRLLVCRAPGGSAAPRQLGQCPALQGCAHLIDHTVGSSPFDQPPSESAGLGLMHWRAVLCITAAAFLMYKRAVELKAGRWCPGQVVTELPLPAPAAAAVAFDPQSCRAVVACLSGEVVCLRSGAASAAPQRGAEQWHEADWRPAKRRSVAGLDDHAAHEPAGPKALLPVLPPAGGAGSRPEPDAVGCTGGASSIHVDAAASFTACAAASVTSPVFGCPAVDVTTGSIVCASVAGEVVALSAGEDRMVRSDARCCVLVLLVLQETRPSDSARPEVWFVATPADFELLWTTQLGAPVYAPLSLLQPVSICEDTKPRSSGGRAGSDCLGAAHPAQGSRGGGGGGETCDTEAGSGTVVLAADQAGRLSGLCLRCGRLLWALDVQWSDGDTISGGIGGDGVGAAVPLRASVAVRGPLLPAWSAAAGPPRAGKQAIAWTAGPGAAGITEVPDSRCVCCSPSTAIASDAAAVNSYTVRPPEGSVQAAGSAVPLTAAAMPAETFSTPVVFGGRLVFGCRDDHLYCVTWAQHT